MEDTLTELMFETPSDETITKIVITQDVITDKAQPQIFRDADKSVTVKINQKDAKKRQKRNTAS